ncbi:putrescine-binding periplasmic protein [Alphaproteobacteria bacterium]|nr:putrescine-binding periplasmic protein [Alphaproteobacteria bacterium]
MNVYDWYGVLPQDVLVLFEKETGIRVHYDVFDNNEMLEAKLLATNSGYDVVFPTLTPYAARQLDLGIYQKINHARLPNLRPLEPFLAEKMKKIDPNMTVLLPYYWGTTGLAFDADKLETLLPNTPKEGYDLLFDPHIIKILAPHGISFLQEAVDVFPAFFAFLGKNQDNRDLNDLFAASLQLNAIGKKVRRFSSARFVADLVSGDVCLAQAWSGEALRAIEDAKKVGRNIRYIIPKKGADIWVDAIAIPVGAPHVANAHVFINFLLRPDISARITNYSKMATMVAAAKPFLEPQILQDPLIFPPDDVLESLHIPLHYAGQEANRYERVRNRIWSQIKMHRKVTPTYFQELLQKQRTHNAGKTSNKEQLYGS